MKEIKQVKNQKNFERILKELDNTGKIVQRSMQKYVASSFQNTIPLEKVLQYSLTDIGKRIRPFLVRMGYEIGGGNFREVLPIASAVELMQLCTLVIDDILDRSPKRNKKDSVFIKWGDGVAILNGEILKSLAVLLSIETLRKNKKVHILYDIVGIFENTYLSICRGQFMDLSYERRNLITEAEYFEMIKKTTAIFVQNSIRIGAVLSEVQKTLINCLCLYGLKLGLAYQIRDDILDVIGDEQSTGKFTGGDIVRGKKRLPIIYAHKLLSMGGRKYLKRMLRGECVRESEVNRVKKLLHECGAIDLCILKVRDFCEEAVAHISKMQNCKQKNLLIELASLISFFDGFSAVCNHKCKLYST